MYNRYIPQPDGSFQRNRIQDTQKQEMQPIFSSKKQENIQSNPAAKVKTEPALPLGSFFRKLLPADFSTEDLMIVILLMLMAEEQESSRSNALLTLAFYLFF